MKKLLLLLLAVPLLAVAQKTPQGVTYDAQILRITDGDTVVIAAPFLPKPLKPELAVRVFGVDTPEKGHRAQCPQEAQRGEAASAFTKNAIATAAAAGWKVSSNSIWMGQVWWSCSRRHSSQRTES
jgi:endonuclease YncB( thermonuclease family)